MVVDTCNIVSGNCVELAYAELTASIYSHVRLVSGVDFDEGLAFS